MTPTEIVTLAERAREHYRVAQGLPKVEWHRLTMESQRAWTTTTELIVSETCRRLQRERLEITEGRRDGT